MNESSDSKNNADKEINPTNEQPESVLEAFNRLIEQSWRTDTRLMMPPAVEAELVHMVRVQSDRMEARHKALMAIEGTVVMALFVLGAIIMVFTAAVMIKYIF